MEKSRKIHSYSFNVGDVVINILRVIDYFSWYADYNDDRYGSCTIVNDSKNDEPEQYSVLEQHATESMIWQMEKAKGRTLDETHANMSKLIEKYKK